MAALFRPLFSTFLSVLLLLLHLGCFILSSQSQRSKKRKLSSHRDSSPPPPRLKNTTTSAISSSWSYIKRIFSTNKSDPVQKITSPIHRNPSIPSPCSSTRSLQKHIIVPISSDDPINRSVSPIPESDISSDQLFFPLRNDIYPCTLCGEVFQSPIHLEQHQSIKHAITELIDGDSGNNIVRIIFQTGWADKTKNPSIHRILKIHNSKRILTRFEEYREYVKLKASRNAVVKRDERCIADGNELLRFHCTTFMCELLGRNGNSSICTQQYCSVCGIIKSGFSHKMDGISMQPTSWRAHVAVPEEIEEEFGFMNVKRAILVCRFIAGWIGCDPDYLDKGFDSLAGRENGVPTRLDEEDELLVFNSRAVLPCFVIVYTV